MPKQKSLTERFTIRTTKYLHDEVVKYCLSHDIEYGEFFRLSISSFLRKKAVKSNDNKNGMSATKNTNFSISSSHSSLPDASLFGITSADDYYDDIGSMGDTDNLGLN